MSATPFFRSIGSSASTCAAALLLAASVGACGGDKDKPAPGSGGSGVVVTSTGEVDITGLEDAYAIPARVIRFEPGAGQDVIKTRKRAFQVYRELKQGADFGEMARKLATGHAAWNEGFSGFIRTEQKGILTGALQALEPGAISRPVSVEGAFVIVQRLPFEQAMELERRLTIPAYAVAFPYGGQEGQVSREVAKERAESFAKHANDPTNDFFAMSEKLERPQGQQGPAARLVRVSRAPSDKERRSALEQAKDYEVVGPFESNGAFEVLLRAPYMRAVMQEILIHHIGVHRRASGVTRTRDEALALAKQISEELQADPSAWSRLVQAHSDRRMIGGGDGLVGMVGNGDLPPVVERAMARLGPGEVAQEPVESPFGFHILRRAR